MAYECQNMRAFYTILMTLVRYSMFARHRVPLPAAMVGQFTDRHGNKRWAQLFDRDAGGGAPAHLADNEDRRFLRET